MKPNSKFLAQQPDLWANVKFISHILGYTEKSTRQIKVPKIDDIVASYGREGLATTALATDGVLTEFGTTLMDYFLYRADLLNNKVEPLLMNVEKAKRLFDDLYARYSPAYALPMNKQKGDKKAPAYFTSIINMLIKAHSQGYSVNYDPRLLTSFTHQGLPVRTLSRRVDGAFPDTINPIAIWEIKEYYYKTTFGSRVADGVYETLLDGLELLEVKQSLNLQVSHYLMVDDYFTWWSCGRSYLCRICDMLHMGLVNEVLFGYEVVDRLPILVNEWVGTAKAKGIQPI